MDRRTQVRRPPLQCLLQLVRNKSKLVMASSLSVQPFSHHEDRMYREVEAVVDLETDLGPLIISVMELRGRKTVERNQQQTTNGDSYADGLHLLTVHRDAMTSEAAQMTNEGELGGLDKHSEASSHASGETRRRDRTNKPRRSNFRGSRTEGGSKLRGNAIYEEVKEMKYGKDSLDSYRSCHPTPNGGSHTLISCDYGQRRGAYRGSWVVNGNRNHPGSRWHRPRGQQ